MDWSTLFDTASFIILLPEFLGEEKIKELERSIGLLSERVARSFLRSRVPLSSARSVLIIDKQLFLTLMISTFAFCLSLVIFRRTDVSLQRALYLSFYFFVATFLFHYSGAITAALYEIDKEDQSPIFRLIVGFIFSILWPAWVVLAVVATVVSRSLSAVARALQREQSTMRPLLISAGIIFFFLARIVTIIQTTREGALQ